MWIAILALGCFFHSADIGRLTRNAYPGDTISLFKTDTVIIVGTIPAVLPFKIQNKKKPKYNSNLKTLLFFEHPVLITSPEGVYELYITTKPPDTNLSSSDKEFVNLLDLYSRTAPGARDRIEMDISEPLKRLFLQNKPVVAAYICIRFGPVKLPNGSYSKKAGELRIKGVRIIQTGYGP